jgi:hypothetical protein
MRPTTSNHSTSTGWSGFGLHADASGREGYVYTNQLTTQIATLAMDGLIAKKCRPH